MGIGGISIWQLLIILVIVFMLFGTKKLRNIGGDLGSAIKDFKNVFKENEPLENKKDAPQQDSPANLDTIQKNEQTEHKNNQ